MRPQRCGLASHKVGKYGPPVLVKERYLDAIRKIRKDFDSSYTVCAGCYESLKKGILRRHLDKKNNTISLKSSSQSSTTSSEEVYVLPLSESNVNRQPASQNQANDSDSSSISSAVTSRATVVPRDPFDGPTTSLAAAARQAAVAAVAAAATHQATTAKQPAAPSNARNKQKSIRFYLEDTQNAPRRTRDQMIQDALNDRSPNATNGTRLPNIQPAPKRRRYVTQNKDVMDIYVAGTTGG